ncbi:histidine kinase dimerization/phospho-acceptor domain-containing protein [Glaciecola sp. MF2-115]|uniref:histidine kinase dimerization/phospho-acceptor domain-containing protein n=1 Tax=Glaciecola sp. MF2-115 TaxID=3384827 RepID=UPI0039A155A7
MSDLNQKIHDIRKPLNSITMQAELIKMINKSADNQAKVGESADKIIENAQLCSQLLQDLFESLSNE